MSTKTKTKESVDFVSRDQNLRLVVEPKLNQLDPQTGNIHQTPGKHVEFNKGVYSVDPKDSETLKFLREHSGFEASPADNSFVERGNEPDRPVDASAVLEAIVDAAVKGDEDRLAELYLAEQSSHSRPEVLKAAARAIDQLGADKPDPPPTPVHEMQRVRDPSIQTDPENPAVAKKPSSK